MTDRSPMHEIPPGMPRWLKIGLIVAALLIVLVVVLSLALGVDHGPGRH